MVAAGQRGWRPPSQEQQDQREVPDGASDPSVAFPPPRGRECRNVGVFEAPSPAEPPDEVHVLHERQLRVAPELFDLVPPREQGLISVREIEESTPKPDTLLDPSRPASVRVERETKAAADDR